jgi:membrane-associated phospholipid phosphatase/tRNA A-37 threonylcarbamoyl transferase component Bud32
VTGKLWLGSMLAVTIAGTLVLAFRPAPLDRLDAEIMRAVASIRVPWLTSLARAINTVNAHWSLPAIGLAVVVAIAVFRRWRQLILLLITLFVLELFAQGMNAVAQRPRPFDVTILAGWQGYAAPSVPVAALTAVLVAAAYALVVPGRPRYVAKWAIAVVVLGLAAARVYLGVDHPTDVVFAALLGVAVPVILFRAFAPAEVYPVRYGTRGKTAHLDVTGKRGDAIRSALLEQLGLAVVEIAPVGLEGSGGSTPLRLLVEDGDGARRHVFAKLYARSHVHADRWYKLGRQMLYGRLEDETPFGTVRRFVEYEDYTLRLLGELGFPTPEALGVVEITPEREYMIVMEFFDGAVEIGEAEVDESVIDQGLGLIRQMWDQGLAHRDVKPANLMVRDGRLLLIDVFFVQLRPSPWRQAVDLGNMMLVLALRSDADTVYEHALRLFTPEELASTLGVDARALERLMNSAVALGFLEKRGALFVNSPAALACLAHEGPFYIGHLVQREAAFTCAGRG